MSNQVRRSWFVLIGVWLFLGLAACAGGNRPAATGPQIEVEGVWGRPSPKVPTAGAFYMVIRNTGNEADRLVGAQSSACGTVELHESYQTQEGAMGMRPVPGGFIEIPAGGQVELKVGGLHVMCIGKLKEFKTGSHIPLTLRFEKSGAMTLEVEIRE